MKVAMTGSNGLIGTALAASLASDGIEVVPVKRIGSASPAPSGAPWWRPDAKLADLSPVDGAEVFIHLGGEPIATHRWNAQVKSAIYSSRVYGTTGLFNALAQLKTPPKTVISASAVGYYGDRGAEVLTEESPSGTGFLAQVARDWEEAALGSVIAKSTSVSALRTGIVLAGHGGLLPRLATIFRLGGGGALGGGTQYMSWISIDDHIQAIRFLIDHPEITGPVNLVGPHPVTNNEFTTSLAKTLHRPSFLRAPSGALRIALGKEMADELLLSGQRAHPNVLLNHGFTFRVPTLDEALAKELKR